jgi:hypothetical protein
VRESVGTNRIIKMVPSLEKQLRVIKASLESNPDNLYLLENQMEV